MTSILGSILGILVLSLLVCPILIAVFFLLHHFLASKDEQEAMLDTYLRSDQANNNPPHMPPTYTEVMNSRVALDTSFAFYLDPPELQKFKNELRESSLTTTEKEIRRRRELD